MMSPFNDFFNKTNNYYFNNSWRVDAPVAHTWNALLNYKKWPGWCHGLEKIEPVNRFDHLRKGNHLRSVWKGSLPYSICFDAVIDDITPYSFLAFKVTGDLHGKGSCRIHPFDDNTMINFIWEVAPTKLWMKMSSPFARPIFIENHDQIIQQAISGFTQMIEQKSHGSPPDLLSGIKPQGFYS